jgi:hypothetical protein
MIKPVLKSGCSGFGTVLIIEVGATGDVIAVVGCSCPAGKDPWAAAKASRQAPDQPDPYPAHVSTSESVTAGVGYLATGQQIG